MVQVYHSQVVVLDFKIGSPRHQNHHHAGKHQNEPGNDGIPPHLLELLFYQIFQYHKFSFFTSVLFQPLLELLQAQPDEQGRHAGQYQRLMPYGGHAQAFYHHLLYGLYVPPCRNDIGNPLQDSRHAFYGKNHA